MIISTNYIAYIKSKEKILILLFLFVSNICSGQSIKHKKLQKKEQFKIDQSILNKYQILKQNKIAQFNSKDGFIITVIDLDSAYQISKQKPKSPFKTFYVYNKKGYLTASGKLFYEIYIGFSTEYGGNGKVISRTNEDLQYDFSVYDLICKMRKDFKIDIVKIDPEVIDVDRNIEDDANHTPTYKILIKNEAFVFRDIIINGITGELISDQIVFGEE